MQELEKDVAFISTLDGLEKETWIAFMQFP